MHKAFISAGRGQYSQNQCYALPSKRPPLSMHLRHQIGTLERQYPLLPLALHWHFIFRIAAFVILKKLVQRILWARYYTIIPQTKRKSTLQQLGYSYSTPIQLSEWSAAKWLCVFWHTKTKVFFFTTHLLEDGKMLFFPQAILEENSE